MFAAMSAALAAALAAAALAAAVCAADLDFALGLQLVGAVGDDLLTGAYAAGEDGRRPLAQNDLHGQHLNGLVGLDGVNVRPLRSVLNRGGGPRWRPPAR